MAEKNHKQVDLAPAPYGRGPDGNPLTALDASAKQMDDWADRHGFSGSVRMGIGPQDGEPEGWRGVNIGSFERLHGLPRPRPLEILDEKPASLPEPSPTRKSWSTKLLDLLKGAFSAKAS